MLAKERRLVGEVGEPPSTSLLVRVPKVWARSVGVRKGSEVTVAFGPGSILFVVPRGAESELDRLVRATGGAGASSPSRAELLAAARGLPDCGLRSAILATLSEREPSDRECVAWATALSASPKEGSPAAVRDGAGQEAAGLRALLADMVTPE